VGTGVDLDVLTLMAAEPARERPDDSTPKGALVLGMHRSGTSAATGLINLLGLSTCVSDDLLIGARTNAKGHWESKSLFKFNDRLLAEMGRTWWYPPSMEELDHWEADQNRTTYEEGRSAFDRVHPDEPWVWKDPRTCLTLSFWRHALSQRAAGIIVFRNPLDVAHSLNRRDYMSIEFGVALWARYNRMLVEQAGGMPVLMTPYDDIVRDPEQWCEDLRGFLSGVGVDMAENVTRKALRQFVDPKLQHSSHSRAELGSAGDNGEGALLYDAFRDLSGAHTNFVVPVLDPESGWVNDQLAAIGPEWHSTWKVPGSTPPTLNSRVRSLVRRATSLKR
jgi:hypothetical protein